MKLIIPAAGKSTRFPDMPPKWLLKHPTGQPMFIEAIKGLPLQDFEAVYLTVLNNQSDYPFLRDTLDGTGVRHVVTTIEPTKSQSETVYETIRRNNITGSIMIKDVDNCFKIDAIEGNQVCTASLYDVGKINAGNKSYVEVNKGVINNIIEKTVISSTFCVGGYSFNNAEDFVKTYKRLSRIPQADELYVSHIIFDMILDGATFTTNPVKDYTDWGTLEDWNDFLRTFKS